MASPPAAQTANSSQGAGVSPQNILAMKPIMQPATAPHTAAIYRSSRVVGAFHQVRQSENAVLRYVSNDFSLLLRMSVLDQYQSLSLPLGERILTARSYRSSRCRMVQFSDRAQGRRSSAIDQLQTSKSLCSSSSRNCLNVFATSIHSGVLRERK